MTKFQRVLFICSRNRWRSPTAERVFADEAELECRSRGLSAQSARQLRDADLQWADVIFVMERHHARRLRTQFRRGLGGKQIHVLDIPDQFHYMDPELIDLFKQRVPAFLDDLQQT